MIMACQILKPADWPVEYSSLEIQDLVIQDFKIQVLEIQDSEIQDLALAIHNLEIRDNGLPNIENSTFSLSNLECPRFENLRFNQPN